MTHTLTREQHLELYYFMQLNRQLEERMVRLFRQNKIVGGLYSSLGQEAVSVGTCYALEKKDWIAPMIRNIGALLVRAFLPAIFSRSTWRNTLRRRRVKTAPAISATCKCSTLFRPFRCLVI